MSLRFIVFYLAAAVAFILFALGVAANVAFWLSGAERRRRWGFLTWLLRLVFSASGLRVFLTQALGQGQLRRESWLRWTMSMSLLWGSIELFFVGSLGNSLRDYGIYPLSRDAPWFALMNDTGGALVLLGLALAGYRRYGRREPQLAGGREAGLILSWIAVIVLSGYAAEAARLLAQGVAPSLAAYSFLGYAFSWVLGPLTTSWLAVEPYLWWLHIGLALGLLAYLPHSQLFHLLVAPLSLMLRDREARLSQEGSYGVR